MDKKVEQNQEAKLQIILYAAFDAFMKFGVKRTSMADIAEGAEMSRAALYLHFKNKNDILRSLIETYYAQSCADVSEALSTEAAIPDQLKAGFLAPCGEAFRALLDSPHGAEFMEAKSSAQQSVADGNAALIEVYATWLQRQAEAGRLEFASIDPDARSLAATMMRALEGLKSDAPRYEEYARRRDQMALLFGRALQC